MVFFTICSKNFLGFALSLCNSLQAHHGPIRFYAALCDQTDDVDAYSQNFEMITLEQLGIPNLDAMIDRYNITELNTSIKPFVFSYLFDQHPGEPVIYLDPDILVTSQLTELEALLELGADCVLIPHILEPAEFAEMDDRQFLVFGIYNLGFCALRDTQEVRRVVSWWGRRLETHCVIDLKEGIFVDQKWADLFPAFIEKTEILRHPGYNVAYWNLPHRRVRSGEEGWTVNETPLRFFHFSGNKIEDPTIFSRHSTQFRMKNIGDLRLLAELYRRTVHDHGHNFYSTLSYGFSWNGETGENAHAPQALLADREQRTGVTPYLPLLRSKSREAFNAARAQMEQVIDKRVETECNAIPFDSEAFRLPGFCACCGRESVFQVGNMYSSRRLPDGREVPNWREHLNCLGCGLVNRVRASLHVLQQVCNPDRDASIYMTERLTTTYDWMAQRYPYLQGSEYFVGNHRSGATIGGVRHEDVQNMSFERGVFDYILTFDVLEHVPKPLEALREFFRCLRGGGILMITVPFAWSSQDHIIRAVLHDDGVVEHLMEPEYHGNPVDMEAGSLCFRYFGWQLLDDLRRVGFVEAEVLSYWSERLRHFGDPQFIMMAKKPD
jgi:SAM-dependent methyltransferase